MRVAAASRSGPVACIPVRRGIAPLADIPFCPGEAALRGLTGGDLCTEAVHHAMRPARGIAALRQILDAHGINASGLARLLGVHARMGSKILKGERALTVAHIRLLAARFNVRPDTFLD
ncbi:MAG: helix-turn-helix domain-containing protein [Pirellulales bacterium]